MARTRGALIHLSLAGFSDKTGFALTEVIGHHVVTLATVLAWPRQTIVDVDFAFDSFPSQWTLAFEGVDFVFASSTVETRRRQTLVDLDFALFAHVAGQASASEVVGMVGTSATV